MNNGRSHAAPAARQEGLVTRELEGELLVYDLDTHRSHCLNRAAALIWKACDGRRGVGDIARHVEGALSGAPVDERVVWFALAKLERRKLLREPLARPAALPRLSRRDLIRKVGVGVLGLPLITTITAPTAHAAVSCTGSCTATIQCASGCICTGGPGNPGVCVQP